jgi:GWxTD domain-containing protein
MRHTTLLAITIVLTLATAAHAEPPTRYASWPNGPVKWLMTTDDARAWRSIRNDADARQFIALFWARRDPTPGTAENEYRDEFEHRVAVADVVFTRNGTRGALTDPGRVYIVLGPPAGSSLPRFGVGRSPGGKGGGSLPQAIGTFHYENAGALHLADPLIRFVSIVDGPYLLSPQGNSFGALDEAVHRAIVSPTLRAVPEWAALTPAWRRFQVTLLYASASPEQHERIEIFPPGVTKAVDDVRALLPWKSYRFVDAITFGARSAQPATSTILAPSGKPYRVELRFTEAGASLNVSPFRVERANGDEIISTTFAIEPAETVSVGTSRGGDAREALLFFVTWIAD